MYCIGYRSQQVRLVTSYNLKGLNMVEFDSTAVVNFMNLGGDRYLGTALTNEGHEVVVTANVAEGQRFKYANWILANKAWSNLYKDWMKNIVNKDDIEPCGYDKCGGSRINGNPCNNCGD